jgi:sugar/nucleoside kinase (ribokinase family)
MDGKDSKRTVHRFRNRYKDKKLIVGVGSALIDILVHEDEVFLSKTGAVKGGTQSPALVPGGSACNTVVGVGKLGGAARFVGKCGTGAMGEFFENDLKRQNVEPALLRSCSYRGLPVIQSGVNFKSS